MSSASTLIAFLLVTSSAGVLVGTPEPAGLAGNQESQGLVGWRSLDDPSADELPEALRLLPQTGRAVFEAVGHPRLLLVRRLDPVESLFEAFGADEEAMARFGDFVPLEDRPLELEDAEGVVMDCEWSFEQLNVRVTTMYAPALDGSLVALWLVSADDAPFEDFEASLMEVLPHFRERLGLAPADRYSGVLLGHDVSFRLSFEEPAADGREARRVNLAPVDDLAGVESEFMDAVAKANPQFDVGVVHRWEDAERDVGLSYQVISHDLGFGPESPFVNWISGQFTTYYRVDRDTGDFPIDLIHVPEVRTNVISEAEIARHYANNERAPEAGVILQVYLPRSPYANVRQVRFEVVEPTEEEVESPPAKSPTSPPKAPRGESAPQSAGEDTGAAAGEERTPGRFGLARLVELRQYRRSRSETITRISVMMLIARASSREDLELMERQLDLSTLPIDRETGVLAPR